MNKISNKTLVALIAEPKDEQWYLYRDELLRRLEEAENLKCCGNCGIIASILCPKYYVGIVAENYDYWKHCYNWQSDALTRKDREK